MAVLQRLLLIRDDFARICTVAHIHIIAARLFHGASTFHCNYYLKSKIDTFWLCNWTLVSGARVSMAYALVNPGHVNYFILIWYIW